MTFTLKPKPARSLRHALARGLVRAVLMTACLAGGFIVSSAFQPDALVFPEAGPAAPVQTQDKAASLLENRCQPYAEGTIPGHAVVTLPGQEARYVESGVGFGLWGPDEQYGTADDLPGTLHDFCR